MAQFRAQYPEAKLQADDMISSATSSRRATWDSKSDQEKGNFSQKMSSVMSDKYKDLTDEQRAAWGKRSRKAQHTFYAKMSKQERKDHYKLTSDRARKQYQAMTPAQRTALHQAAVAGVKAFFADDVKYQQYCDNLSIVHKQRFTQMTEQELSEHFARSIGKSPSSLEQVAILELQDAGYVVEPGAKINNYEVDGLIEPNIVVEIFGDYWHVFPKAKTQIFTKHPHTGLENQEIWLRDTNRVAELISWGYRVVVLWEHDILAKGAVKTFQELTQDNTEPSPDRKIGEGVETRESLRMAINAIYGDNTHSVSATTQRSAGRRNDLVDDEDIVRSLTETFGKQAEMTCSVS